MPDWNIATGKEQPLNRTGLENVQETGDVQGMLVGHVQPSGASEAGLYRADADPGYDIDGDGTADGPVPALGVLMPREVMPADMSNVTDHPWSDFEKQTYLEERTLSGDRATIIKYGIEMVNDGDVDANFTPGEPVYLGTGGSLTQDVASLPEGAIVQKVGIALDPEDEGPGASAKGRERVLLSVSDEYATGGEAAFSGDASTVTFSIPHNLGDAPSRYDVTPTSADAAADHYVTATATSLDVTFLSAPAAGTDNVTFEWNAQE